MTILRVAKMGHPCLRTTAIEISSAGIASPKVQGLIDDMVDTMVDYQGIGLAAPQVFQSLRLIVVGDPEVDTVGQTASGADDDVDEKPTGGIPLTVVVNPQVDGHSAERVEDWEGCLSIPDMHGRVPRSLEICVTGLDRQGNPVRLQTSGVFARVLQHELDHLNGILFIDHLPKLKRKMIQKKLEK